MVQIGDGTLANHNKYRVFLDWKFECLFADIEKHNGMMAIN